MRKIHKNSGTGEAYKFIREHMNYEGDDCVLWPFARLPKGYGHLGHKGRLWRAHRLMCVLTYGDPPTPKHYACHSCHTPSCINPKHLRWDTSSANHLDQRPAGTQATSKYGYKGALTQEQANQIRALQGMSTQAALAITYGVSEETIRRIHNNVTYTGKQIDHKEISRRGHETKRAKRAAIQ